MSTLSKNDQFIKITHSSLTFGEQLAFHVHVETNVKLVERSTVTYDKLMGVSFYIKSIIWLNTEETLAEITMYPIYNKLLRLEL